MFLPAPHSRGKAAPIALQVHSNGDSTEELDWCPASNSRLNPSCRKQAGSGIALCVRSRYGEAGSFQFESPFRRLPWLVNAKVPQMAPTSTLN